MPIRIFLIIDSVAGFTPLPQMLATVPGILLKRPLSKQPSSHD
jgi:hypothetical protein